VRAVIQRVTHANVDIEGTKYSGISNGLFILLGIQDSDTNEDIKWLSNKIVNMRIFSDKDDKMNLSVMDIEGELLIVSQFTLHASTKKGNRPSFIKAASAETALVKYKDFIKQIRKDSSLKVETGKFGAMMDISFVNSGPVTILMDSKNKE
jgi:D-tyrosyl-tRNA(Tyr) deacylase